MWFDLLSLGLPADSRAGILSSFGCTSLSLFTHSPRFFYRILFRDVVFPPTLAERLSPSSERTVRGLRASLKVKRHLKGV